MHLRRRTLAAMVDALLAPDGGPPEPADRERERAAVTAALCERLGAMPRHLRLALALVLGSLELSGWPLGAPFHRLPRGRRQRLLAAWRAGPAGEAVELVDRLAAFLHYERAVPHGLPGPHRDVPDRAGHGAPPGAGDG